MNNNPLCFTDPTGRFDIEAANKTYLYRDIIKANKCSNNEYGRMQISNEPYNHEDTCFLKLLKYIDKNFSVCITLEDLSHIIGMNQAYLCRIFKEKYGIPPIKYVNNVRLQKAKELLMQPDLNITEIAYAVGFQNIHYFSKYFKQEEGISPLAFREQSTYKIIIKLEDQYRYVKDNLIRCNSLPA